MGDCVRPKQALLFGAQNEIARAFVSGRLGWNLLAEIRARVFRDCDQDEERRDPDLRDARRAPE